MRRPTINFLAVVPIVSASDTTRFLTAVGVLAVKNKIDRLRDSGTAALAGLAMFAVVGLSLLLVAR